MHAHGGLVNHRLQGLEVKGLRNTASDRGVVGRVLGRGCAESQEVVKQLQVCFLFYQLWEHHAVRRSGCSRSHCSCWLVVENERGGRGLEGFLEGKVECGSAGTCGWIFLVLFPQTSNMPHHRSPRTNTTVHARTIYHNHHGICSFTVTCNPLPCR